MSNVCEQSCAIHCLSQSIPSREIRDKAIGWTITSYHILLFFITPFSQMVSVMVFTVIHSLSKCLQVNVCSELFSENKKKKKGESFKHMLECFSQPRPKTGLIGKR